MSGPQSVRSPDNSGAVVGASMRLVIVPQTPAGVFEPGHSVEEVASQMGEPNIVVEQNQWALGPSGGVIYGNRGLLVGGSAELGRLELKSKFLEMGTYSHKARFSVPELANNASSVGYFSSPDAKVRQFDMTDFISGRIGGGPVDIGVGGSARIGTDERDPSDAHAYAGVVFLLGLSVYLSRPDPKSSHGFYAKLTATSGIGGGAEFRDADANAYFDWEAVRATAALGGYW